MYLLLELSSWLSDPWPDGTLSPDPVILQEEDLRCLDGDQRNVLLTYILLVVGLDGGFNPAGIKPPLLSSDAEQYQLREVKLRWYDHDLNRHRLCCISPPSLTPKVSSTFTQSLSDV